MLYHYKHRRKGPYILSCTCRLQHGEAFCPLCLPGYSPSTFLHAYVHFLIPATPRSDTQPGNAAGAAGGSEGDCDGIVSADALSGPSHPGLYLVLMCPTSDTFHACSQVRTHSSRAFVSVYTAYRPLRFYVDCKLHPCLLVMPSKF